MKSWDCFDTLIARRFYDPKTVFDEVGRRLGDPTFREKRIQAERACNQNTKTYLDIYKRIPEYSPDIEFSVELEHNYPIVENMQKVQDGDYIVSDMYLSAKQVQLLLETCGLTKNVNYIVTMRGKRQGWVWDQMPKPDLHTGDNRVGDFQSPQRKGIFADLYTRVWFTPQEESIYKNNPELACWMRYLRLQNPYTNSGVKYTYWEESVINLALLALLIKELPEDKKICFTYRDCYYLHKLYESMTGKEANHIHTSRNAYLHAGQEFKDYILSQSKDCLIVDLQGSGRAPATFFKNQKYDIFYLCGRSPDSLFEPCGNFIERHNCAPFGSVLDLKGGEFIRLPMEWDEEILYIQNEIIDVATKSIGWFNIRRDTSLLKSLLYQLKDHKISEKIQIISKHPVRV